MAELAERLRSPEAAMVGASCHSSLSLVTGNIRADASLALACSERARVSRAGRGEAACAPPWSRVH